LRAIGATATALCLLLACAHPSRVTPMIQGMPSGPPMARIAVGPAATSIAQQIAEQLERDGYAVVDPLATAKLLIAHHLDNEALETPEGLEALASGKIDGLLIAVPTGDGYSIRTAVVRLIRTASGETVAAFLWENGHCAMRGSPCDYRAKRSVHEAAAEIVGLLRPSIGTIPGQLIEAVMDDGRLVISGVVFTKSGDCPGFVAGQRVKFTNGDQRGFCATAKLVLIGSGDECDVECPSVN
jgi:hypothetical protein